MAATKIAVLPGAPDAGRGVVGQVGLKPLEPFAFSQPPGSSEITEVWEYNLEDEVDRMRDIAEVYNYVAMETQCPGIVARPTGPFSEYAEYNYQTLKCNIHLTSVVQVSLVFADGRGNRPKGSTWRFNFKFDCQSDPFSEDTLDTRGLDLARHRSQGIEPHAFAELLMSSGLVLNEEVRWITIGGPSSLAERCIEDSRGGRFEDKPRVMFCGLYDLGHMLQMLTSQPLPSEVRGFQESLDLFFPSRCDVAKHLHRLGLVPQGRAGEGLDSRTRLLFRSAHCLLEAFFRLPESIRRTACEREEEALPAEEKSCPSSRRNGRGEERRQQAKPRKHRGLGAA